MSFSAKLSRDTFTEINSEMSVIAILLIASISVAGIFLLAFIWSIKTGQFDDEFSPPRRMLFDDKPIKPEALNAAQSTSPIEA